MSEPTVVPAKPPSKESKFETHAVHLKEKIDKFVTDTTTHVEALVQTAEKDIRFEAEQVRATIAQLAHWIHECNTK